MNDVLDKLGAVVLPSSPDEIPVTQETRGRKKHPLREALESLGYNEKLVVPADKFTPDEINKAVRVDRWREDARIVTGYGQTEDGVRVVYFWKVKKNGK